MSWGEKGKAMIYGIRLTDRLINNNAIVTILNNALHCMLEAFRHIREILETPPQEWFNGSLWPIVTNINSVIVGIGLSLLVLFLAAGIIRTCTSFNDIKRPEQALKLFLRFIIAKATVTHGFELLMGIFKICQGVYAKIIANFTNDSVLEETFGSIPPEIVEQLSDVSFFKSVPMWLVALISMLVFAVLAIIMVASVYGRIFKIGIYASLAPLSLSSFAAEHTQHIGLTFLKSFAVACLQGAVIALIFILGLTIMTTPKCIPDDPVSAVWDYMLRVAFQAFVMVGLIKISDQIIREMGAQ